jgi:tetratricopeptide (TPR) repeat protein
MLSWQDGHCGETIDAARQFIALYPYMNPAYRWLGYCLTVTGQADAALPVLEQAVRLDGPAVWRSHDYRNLQQALLLLGRNEESIGWGERALTANPDDSRWERARLLRRIAAAEAQTGRLEDAQRNLAESLQLWPYMTLRQVALTEAEGGAYAPQVARLLEGLRRAGMRDHADEDADFGVPEDRDLHPALNGLTPMTAPGTTTIRTAALVRLLSERRPVVIDTVSLFAAPSIPGAVGLRYVGEAGTLGDVAQERLRAKMRTLTGGDLARPIVAVGWNSENFGGRNLALRLAALGYTQVYWYRGGREAWSVQGLPQATLAVQDW